MPNTNEQQFLTDAEDVIETILHDNPTFATRMGDHRFDGMLSDLGRESLERDRKQFGTWLDHFNGFVTEGWSLDNMIDHTLLMHLLKNFIRNCDKHRWIFRNPGIAADECLGGIHMLIVRDFAPLPQRMKSVLGRLREVPRAVAQGRELLIPAEVPRIWAEVAIESIRQGIALFTGIVPQLAQLVPELTADVVVSANTAVASLLTYADWIEHAILPEAKGNFAVGKLLFDEILREDHMVEYDADELLATGWRLIEKIEARMNTLAAQIDPGRTARELLDEKTKEHPAAADLLDTYRTKMTEARQLVVDRRIVSIPDGECIRIEPTPQFLRPVIPFAAYDPPGFLDTVQEGIFYVTPVESDAGPDVVEKRLRSHPTADIPVTALHEAYPGHHLQFVVANRVGSTLRKIGGNISSLFIEGWAFYCEELMETLGFINQPIQMLARMQAELWRAVRIVLDASLHTKGMCISEAIGLLVQRAGLEPDDARIEVHRYTMSPTQPQSYLMGKIEILKIVNAYKERYPDADMCRMHDAILACGSLPPTLMRKRLFESR